MQQQNDEQTKATNWGRRIIALVGIVLIAIGQYQFSVLPLDDSRILPAPTLLILPGIGLLILSAFMRPGQGFQKIFKGLKISETAFGVLLSLVLTGITILSLVLFHTHGKISYLPVTLTWLASGVMYVLAFRGDALANFDLKSWLREYRLEILVVGIAVALGAILRFYQLGNLPRVIDGDEGLMGINAQATEHSVLSNPFALWENFGASYLQLVNFFFVTLGVSPFTLRLLPAISGTLAIAAVYLLARQIAGVRIAMVAAFMLAFSHSHIHFSRIASVGYIHGTWLVPLELYLLLSGLEKRVSWKAAAAGVLLALHLQVYLTSQIVIGLILAFMLISFLFLKNWFRPALKQVGIFWGGFIVSLLPQLYFILNNPNEFFNRLTMDGTFSGWLAITMASTGKSAFELLASRVSHAFLSLIYYPANDFYGSTSPLLSVFSAIFFLTGLGVALVRTKSPGYLILNGYFWGGTLAVGLFAVPPSADSYRMLLTLPPVFILGAMGLDYLLNISGMEWEGAKRAYVLSTAGVLTAMLIMGVWLYYFDFAGKCRYGGGLVGRFASYLGVFARTVDENSEIYVLSDNEYFYGSHASSDFLSQHREITNVPEPMDVYEVRYGETIVANPARIDELQAWIDEHPGGELTKVYDCDNLILIAYQIPEKAFGP